MIKKWKNDTEAYIEIFYNDAKSTISPDILDEVHRIVSSPKIPVGEPIETNKALQLALTEKGWSHKGKNLRIDSFFA